MSARKPGRALDSLIRKTEEAAAAPAPTSSPTTPPDREVRLLDPRKIRVNRAQPRTHFDDAALEELSTSIKNDGILQPLVVRPDEGGGFELVAGERRLRASLAAGLENVPVVVQSIDPERLLRLALIENIQREDLNPIELALAYRALQKEHGWTQEQLAEGLGKKRSSIANALRFLDLEQPIREALASGVISSGHAKLFLSVGEGRERIELFEQASEEGWTVRRLDQAIREAKGELAPAPASASTGSGSRGSRAGTAGAPKDPSITAQEEEMARILGTKVSIQSQGKRGKIVIDYFNLDDFERIRRKLISE